VIGRWGDMLVVWMLPVMAAVIMALSFMVLSLL
jgi:hypothetical protein